MIEEMLNRLSRRLEISEIQSGAAVELTADVLTKLA